MRQDTKSLMQFTFLHKFRLNRRRIESGLAAFMNENELNAEGEIRLVTNSTESSSRTIKLVHILGRVLYVD